MIFLKVNHRGGKYANFSESVVRKSRRINFYMIRIK